MQGNSVVCERKEVDAMNPYVTGTTIKQLRESRNLTQAELAEMIGVSSKTISKWETAKGLPDISLLQLRGMGQLDYNCNRHGLFRKKIENRCG